MMNHLIDSKFYELCDVKRFNDFIMSLKKLSDESYHHQYIEYNFVSVNELIKIHKPYEDLTKYVENSPSWLKLKQQYTDWENAQEQLKQLKHTSEQVLDEIYPTYLTIYKHTITIPDKDFDDFVIEKTYSFYVKGYGGEVIEDWDSLLLPYTNKAYCDEKDLITEACDRIKWLNQQVLSILIQMTINLLKREKVKKKRKVVLIARDVVRKFLIMFFQLITVFVTNVMKVRVVYKKVEINFFI